MSELAYKKERYIMFAIGGHEVTESCLLLMMIKIDYSENQFFRTFANINSVDMLFRRTFWKIQIYEFLQTSAGA